MRHVAIVALAAAGLAAAGLGWTSAAASEKRVALVIGNSAYVHAAPLPNPINDAADMAAALKGLDFEVIEGFDLDDAGMRSKVRAFAQAIEGASVALFYFAGHGLQLEGNNHLAPIDARLEREADVDFETLPLNFILRQMEREQRTNIVFLDACRDNPLARRLARSLRATRSGAVSSGLARVESGIGTLIGYSTSPGEVALDGDGRNSPYTGALLKYIDDPGQDINAMMIRVRQDVLSASNGKQVPWEHSSLTGQFYFNPAPTQIAAASPEPEPEESAPAVTQSDADSAIRSAYQATVAIGSCGAYRAFEEQHRGSFYARLAEEFLRENCAEAERAGTRSPDPADAADEPARAGAEADTDTETQVAALDPASIPETAEPEPAELESAPAPEGRELVRALQENLARVGCEPGPVDGAWGRRTRAALERFNRHAGLDLPTGTPTPEAFAAIETHTDRVCPPERRAPVADDRAPPVRSAPPERAPRAQPAPSRQGICFSNRGQIVACDSPDAFIGN